MTRIVTEAINRAATVTVLPGGYEAKVSIVERNNAAEVRAVEEGHRALLAGDGAIRVVSDVDDDLAYRVTGHAVDTLDGPVVFECQPVERRTGRPVDATHGHTSAAPGVLPCKHAGVAVRRLEREGLAELRDGLWHATPLAAAIVADRLPPQPDDPFQGL